MEETLHEIVDRVFKENGLEELKPRNIPFGTHYGAGRDKLLHTREEIMKEIEKNEKENK